MTYTATQHGEYPTGLHWTAGESRVLTPEAAADAPAWLVAVPPPVEPTDVPPAPEDAS